MTTPDKNILTPDFYEFLMSNKAAYGKTVLDQINDASEKINISSDEKESLAVVLSGQNVNVTDGSSTKALLFNQPEIVTLNDGIPRRKIKFRSIDSRTYANTMQDFSSFVGSPLSSNMSKSQREYLISMHPDAYTLTGYFETNPMPFGCIIVVKEMGGLFYIVENVSVPFIKANPTSVPRDLKGLFPPKERRPVNMVGIKTTRRMKPLLQLDGVSESTMTSAEAGNNMQNETLKRYRTMQTYLDFDVTINDAIAKKGTSRERTTKNSQHFKGRALDLNIRGLTEDQKLQMLDAASQAGFTSFGFGKGILHVDWGGGYRRWDYGGISKWGGVPLGKLFKWVRPDKGVKGSGSAFKLLQPAVTPQTSETS